MSPSSKKTLTSTKKYSESHKSDHFQDDYYDHNILDLEDYADQSETSLNQTVELTRQQKRNKKFTAYRNRREFARKIKNCTGGNTKNIKKVESFNSGNDSRRNQDLNLNFKDQPTSPKYSKNYNYRHDSGQSHESQGSLESFKHERSASKQKRARSDDEDEKAPEPEKLVIKRIVNGKTEEENIWDLEEPEDGVTTMENMLAFINNFTQDKLDNQKFLESEVKRLKKENLELSHENSNLKFFKKGFERLVANQFDSRSRSLRIIEDVESETGANLDKMIEIGKKSTEIGTNERIMHSDLSDLCSEKFAPAVFTLNHEASELTRKTKRGATE